MVRLTQSTSRGSPMPSRASWESAPRDLDEQTAERIVDALERTAAAAETIASTLTDARACAVDRWTRLRANLPWLVLWVVILITNMDKDTRSTILGIWKTFTGALQ